MEPTEALESKRERAAYAAGRFLHRVYSDSSGLDENAVKAQLSLARMTFSNDYDGLYRILGRVKELVEQLMEDLK